MSHIGLNRSSKSKITLAQTPLCNVHIVRHGNLINRPQLARYCIEAEKSSIPRQAPIIRLVDRSVSALCPDDFITGWRHREPRTSLLAKSCPRLLKVTSQTGSGSEKCRSAIQTIQPALLKGMPRAGRQRIVYPPCSLERMIVIAGVGMLCPSDDLIDLRVV